MRRPARPPLRPWPLVPLALLAAALTVGVLGVAGAPAETEADRVTATVEDFSRALREQRGEEACGLLTAQARAVVATSTGRLGCAGTLRTFGIGVDAGRLAAAEVTGAAITGGSARIAPGQLVLPDGRPAGPEVLLERTADGWRIARVARPGA